MFFRPATASWCCRAANWSLTARCTPSPSMRSRTCSDPKEPAMNTSWPLASRRVLLTGGPGMGRVGFVAVDLRDMAGAQSTVRALEREQGSFDILINNAALITHKPFEEFSLAEYEEVMQVNSSAGFALTQAVAPAMKAKGWGRIINFCSL